MERREGASDARPRVRARARARGRHGGEGERRLPSRVPRRGSSLPPHSATLAVDRNVTVPRSLTDRAARADLPSKCEASVRCLLYVRASERERVFGFARSSFTRDCIGYLGDVSRSSFMRISSAPGRRDAAQYRR